MKKLLTLASLIGLIFSGAIISQVESGSSQSTAPTSAGTPAQTGKSGKASGAHTKLAAIFNQKAALHTQLAQLSQQQGEYALRPDGKKRANDEQQRNTLYAKEYQILAQIETIYEQHKGPKRRQQLKPLWAQLKAIHQQLWHQWHAKKGSAAQASGTPSSSIPSTPAASTTTTKPTAA